MRGPRRDSAKRGVLFAALILLSLVEAYLCTAFLPQRWQNAIESHIPDILPKSDDQIRITHPLLKKEVEQVLREHAVFRFLLYGITASLVIGNAWLIRRVWRLVHSAQIARESQ